MKRFKGTPSRSKGFTLMELLVVVSIMVILAGLTMGTMTYVNQKQAVEQAKIQLGLLELGLEDYHSETGEYPINAVAAGTNGTSKIQKVLFPTSSAKKIYMTELDPNNDTQGWLSGSGNSYDIVDPWGSEYRYRTNNPARASRTYAANPGFDLWSVGPDGETQAGNSGGYDPEHPMNLDDIRLW